MISKLQPLSKMTLAFLMALFSVWTWGQKTYQLVTSTADLVAGSKYLVVSRGTAGAGYALGYQNTNNRPQAAVTVNSSLQITTNVASTSSDQSNPYETTLGGTSGAWTLYDAANSGYLYAASNSSNYLKNQSTSTTWTITIAASGNAATMTSQSGVSNNILKYNGTSSLFSCYASNSSGQSLVYLYKEVPTVAPVVTGSNQTGSVGSTFSYQIQATNSPSSYAVASGSNLPGGLSLNTSNGLISGTPTTAGTFATDITATNTAGTSAPATINFTITKGTQVLTGFVDQSKYLSSTPFTFPANTTNANLAITYTSSNNSVATISGNTITITGVGTSNITATQAGDNNWNALSQQIVLTVVNDPVTYNGVGRFEKITSLADLADGYYVVVGDGTNAMNTTVASNKLQATTVNIISNQIVNPATSVVWKVQTDAGNIKTIFNETVNKYISNGSSSTDLSLVASVSGNGQKWGVSFVSSLFRLTNQADTSRALIYNGSVFGKYATSNVDGSSYFDLELYKMVESTTWNGSAWSNGNPGNKDVIITGVYSTTSQPAFTAKNITIKNGGVLEITSGNTIGAASVTVENGGNFIQRDGSTLTNTGAFNVLKNTTSAANKYVFWASPTASQNMYGIHTSTPQYVMTYDSTTDYYTTLGNPATSTPGVGYSVKMPAANATATFGGATAQPNNGNVAVTLNNTSTNKYNLIGNPYPSNLDLNAFYNANSSSVNSTFWFWDNTSNNVTTQTGNTTTNVGYATYNAAGSGTWTEAPSSLASHSGSSAAVGQGFIVEATGTTATFTNAMRISTTGNTFNKLNGNDTGKFWLKLATPYGSHTTLAVNYEAGAQNAFDKFDSRAMGIGSDAFYSTVGTEKLVIQGKAPFIIDDVVPLGNKHFEAGNFVISLTQKEGVFNNGQAIYLHDKELGTYTNLQNGNYSFSANAGEFTNRFEIVYKFGALATQEIEKTTFEVYKDGEDFVARNSKNIEKVEVFDASGRKIIELKPNASIVKFKLEAKGMYVLRAISGAKDYTKKLIK